MIFIHVIILFAVIRSTYQVLYTCDRTAQCGCSFNSASVSRIVGGEVANIATWGGAVSLSYVDGNSCGASILSSSWIITAAHCVIYYEASEVFVHAGSNIQWSGSQNRTVSQIISHANFNFGTFSNDIALLKLTDPLNMSDPNINPICMPLVNSTILESGEWPIANTTVVAVGWGKLSENGLFPGNLRQVTLKTVGNQASTCNRLVSNKSIQLCAGEGDGIKDTCQGDSGGPLMMFTRSNRWVLIGLTSFGEGCARKNNSGVYTRVAAYENWIRSYTNDSYWIVPDSHGNTIFTSITRLYFFILPFIFLLIIY